MRSKRSLGLALLAVAYLQVAVGFIATGGTSGLLKYGYAWARDVGFPADQFVGVLFILAAVIMIVGAVGRRWRERLATIGYTAAVIPVTIHMVTCCVGAAIGDLNLLEYQSAFGSQIGIIVILILLHDWPDPSTVTPPTTLPSPPEGKP